VSVLRQVLPSTCTAFSAAAQFATACTAVGAEDQARLIETGVAGTVEAQADLAATVAAQVEQTVSALAVDLTQVAPANTPGPQTAIATSAPPNPNVTPTPPTLLLSLRANTHCRSGPSGAYDLLATFVTGQTAEAVARSTVDDYWYVANPERTGEFCWLWGQYATAAGDASVLPVYTPLPSPTPGPAFGLSFSRVFSCGDIHAVFKVTNTSPYTFLSAERSVLDLDTGTYLASPETDSSPFVGGSSNCPIGTGSRLDPGQVAYVYVPLNPVPSGDTARGTIRLCTQPGLGGLCYTQAVNFDIP
jgi:hypothetical protein